MSEQLADLGPWSAALDRRSRRPAVWGETDDAAFTDYLDERNDPRAELVRGHQVQMPFRGTGTHAMNYQQFYGPGPGRATHDLDDLRIKRNVEDGTKDVYWDVGWWPTARSGFYQKEFKDDEFREWFAKLPAEVRGKLKKSAKVLDRTLGPGERKLKLARDREPGPGAGIRDSLSANHDARLKIAKEVLREAGLDPARVRAAIHYQGKSAAAAVVQAINRRVDPARIKYAAAWYGLLSNSPAVTVFHPVPTGEDTLHVIDSPHPADHMGRYLSAAGVPRFTVESHAAGSRAYVFDPGSTMNLSNAVGGLDARSTRIRGSGYRLGNRPGAGPDSRADAAARATYRDAITDYERG